MSRVTSTRYLLPLVATGLLLVGCTSDGGDASGGGDGAKLTTTTTTASNSGAPLPRYADYETTSYAEPSHWVCRPDADDICDESLDATVVAEDGTLSVEPFKAADDPAIDCFYVYPTISRDETTFADWELSPDEEGYVTVNQAARLQSQCRLFAPGYRQITLGGLGAARSGDLEADGDPFADVLDAFKAYMANDNEGRGFVLIGHSQGSSMLNQLIAAEIDPNDDVRALLVGAYLAGSSVTVPEGEIVGGDFANVALCTSEGEVGCVTTWATFRDTAPPPANSFFGAPREGEGVAGCVNPAAPGDTSDLDGYFPANAGASILSSQGASDDGARWVDASAGEITTPFVRITDLVSGACATKDGFNYLEVTINADPDGPRADDIPGDLSAEWGLHLVDVSLVMGDIVRSVESQASAYATN